MIPKKFTLVNRTYTVQDMPAEIAESRLGDCNSIEARIRLAKGQPPECLEHTFYHELAHALLDASTKPKLSKKEGFVDSLGALLHQFMQTQKGEFK